MGHQDSPSVPDVAESNDRFGSSLAAGALQGASRPGGVAMGVPYENVGTASDAGAVSVLYGSGPVNQLWHQNSPGILDVSEGGIVNGDLFGSGLAAGSPASVAGP